MDRIKKLLNEAKHHSDLLHNHVVNNRIDEVLRLLESPAPDPKILVDALQDIADNAFEMLDPIFVGVMVKSHHQTKRIQSRAKTALEEYHAQA